MKAFVVLFTRFDVTGLLLIAVLTAACTFDSSQLRALPDSAVEPSAAPDAGAAGSGDGTANSPDAPIASGGSGGSAGTGGAAGIDAVSGPDGLGGVGGIASGGGNGGLGGTGGRYDAGMPDAPGAPDVLVGGSKDGAVSGGGSGGIGAGGSGGLGGTGGRYDAGMPDAPGAPDVLVGGSGGGAVSGGGSGGIGAGGSGGLGGSDAATMNSGGQGGADAGTSASSDAASCSGPLRGGICWYLGPDGSSCQQVCASHGTVAPGAASHVGTTAQGGSLAECGILLGLLGVTGTPASGVRSDGLGLGCHIYSGVLWWVSSPAFDATASHTSARLVCGCTQ